MIETFCSCGGLVRAAESAGAAPCACGRTVYLAAAEPLAEGMGAGDFDARLVVAAGPGAVGDTIALGGVMDVEVGKGEQRHVRLDGSLVSRAHAKLCRVDFGPSRWRVVDTGSKNGVFVNGERVAEAELADGDLLRVGDYELRFASGQPALATAAEPVAGVARGLGAVTCPGCQLAYPSSTTICTDCGIYIATGRPLVVSRALDDDAVAERTWQWIRWISWGVPFGLFPIASEAFGTKRPRAIWWITGITVAASLLFFVPYYAGWYQAESPWEMWCGSGDPPVVHVHGLTVHMPAGWGGEFHAYQLITAALIHAGIMHLAGNMVFMLVFGIRVNELIGDVKMAIIYPVLAVASGLILYVASMGDPLHPALGASGAIMGLAGMYVVLFPVQRVVMVIWLRLGLLTAWQCLFKIFRVRGVWLLGLWVGLNDLLPTLLAHARGGGTHDGVAHWAHLGGFVAGATIAVGLLVARQVNAHGADLLSVTLGSKAWPLLGKPGERAAA
jgi:membrane associated rhomboid family serine protease